MKKIIKQTQVIENFLGQPAPFEELGTGRRFRRIVGGMQWPGKKPGALVVIGEDLNIDAALDERKLRVLAEYENRNLSELIARCKELEGLMEVEKFYGDTTNLPMMKLMRRGEAAISLSKAPFVDDPDGWVAYLSIIREKTSATKKILNFEKEGSALPAMLASLTGIPTDLKSDYPKIAALGYALSALTVPYKKPRAPGVGYQPLDPVVGY